MSATNDLSPNSLGLGQAFKQFQQTGDVKSKLDWAYGQSLAKYFHSLVTGTNNYFFNRNQRFLENRNIASGTIDNRKFRDRLDFNGEVNYANLNWSSLKVPNTVISRMVSRWMSRREKVDVTATDMSSKASKKDQEKIAEYFLLMKEQLAAEQEVTGVEMIPQDQFIAEDKDDLDLWVAEFNQLPEEIKFSLAVNNVLEANGFMDVNKKKLCHDSAEVGFVGTFTYMNEQGEVIVEWLQPENCFYSFSLYDDFRDTSWRGYIRVKKISEIRSKYGVQNGGKLTEEQLFKIAQTSKEYQLIDKISWMQEWNVAFVRPYDEWNVDVLEFEVKSFDQDTYAVTKTKQRNSTIVSKDIPNKLKENQTLLQDGEWNIYRGVYVLSCQILLEWGLKKNMIRPQDPKEIGNAEFSYSFYMYQSRNCRNLAVPEKIEQPVEQLQLCILKLQQLVAKMKPIGANVNIDALQAIDLGLNEPTPPHVIKKIWEQTGDLYYRGRDAEGNFIQTPIEERANSAFATQAQALISLYQFNYQLIQNELGENPNLQEQIAAPRVTNQNAQDALITSERATEHMYDAVLFVLEQTARKVACLLSDSVAYGAKIYRDILQENDVLSKVFATKIRLLPTETEIARLEGMLNAAIASNPEFSMYVDSFKLLQMAKEDVRLANLYFRRAQKRYLKEKSRQNEANIRANGETQVESTKAKFEADAAMENIKQSGEQRKALIDGFMKLLSSQAQLPQELQQLQSALFTTLASEMQEQLEQKQAEQQAVQEQMMEEGQPMEEEQEMQEEQIVEQ